MDKAFESQLHTRVEAIIAFHPWSSDPFITHNEFSDETLVEVEKSIKRLLVEISLEFVPSMKTLEEMEPAQLDRVPSQQIPHSDKNLSMDQVSSLLTLMTNYVTDTSDNIHRRSYIERLWNEIQIDALFIDDETCYNFGNIWLVLEHKYKFPALTALNELLIDAHRPERDANDNPFINSVGDPFFDKPKISIQELL